MKRTSTFSRKVSHNDVVHVLCVCCSCVCVVLIIGFCCTTGKQSEEIFFLVQGKAKAYKKLEHNAKSPQLKRKKKQRTKPSAMPNMAALSKLTTEYMSMRPMNIVRRHSQTSLQERGSVDSARDSARDSKVCLFPLTFSQRHSIDSLLSHRVACCPVAKVGAV